MSVISHANWLCTHCGARGSGNGQAYEDWLRGHACGVTFAGPPVAKLREWAPTRGSWVDPPSRHQTRPGSMTFTTMRGN